MILYTFVFLNVRIYCRLTLVQLAEDHDKDDDYGDEDSVMPFNNVILFDNDVEDDDHEAVWCNRTLDGADGK